MTLDTALAVLSNVLTVGFSLYAIRVNRRLRSERERAVMAARAAIELVCGTLIGVKPAVVRADPALTCAIDNALSALDGQRDRFERL